MLTGVAAIAAGYGHVCALMTSGGVRCWGDNQVMALGIPGTANVLTPPAADTVTGVRALDCGSGYTCVITTTNTVRCWGNNAWGNLGNGTTTESYKATGDVPTLDGRCQ